MDAHSLTTVGKVATTDKSNDGDYMVWCPRCGYAQDGLTRSEACSRSRKQGCPDCVVPTNDLKAEFEGEETPGETLTNVSNPLAVREA